MDRYHITTEDFSKLLEQLLTKNIVNEILSGKEKGNRYTLEPEFISESQKVKNFPLSQLLIYGFARTDSPANTILRSHKALERKIAVIGHACDIRALVELSKKTQAVWKNLFLITFEDMGYIEVTPMMKFLKNEKLDAAQLAGERLTQKSLILKMKDGTNKKYELGKGINISENCSRCIEKTHPLADFVISTYGLPETSLDYIITPQTDRANILISDLGWNSKKINADQIKAYDTEAQAILTGCSEKREKELNEFEVSKERLTKMAKCTGCGLCVKSCPVCFCPDCNLIAQVKAKKLDKLTFVLTRFSHVGDTCVECGKCNSNCAAGVPLALGFQSIRRKLKKNRNFSAGSNLAAKVLHLDV